MFGKHNSLLCQPYFAASLMIISEARYLRTQFHFRCFTVDITLGIGYIPGCIDIHQWNQCTKNHPILPFTN